MSNQALDVPVPERALRFASAVELIEATTQVLALSRRSVLIYSRDLEPMLLDQSPVLDALRRIALTGRGAQVRMLVQDPGRAIREGHRLIEQSRRLSSIYQFRQVHTEDLKFPGAFVVNDRAGFIARTFADRHEGEGHTHDSARANALIRYFNEVWERSSAPPELRALHL